MVRTGTGRKSAGNGGGTARRRLALALAGGALLALPAIGQEAPKSLLPDEMAAPVESAPVAVPQDLPVIANSAADEALPGDNPLLPDETPEDAAPDAFAQAAVRDLSTWGPMSPAAGGYGPATFAGGNGRFLATLAARLAAPTASRWASIVLRRALLSDSVAPDAILAGDWIAVRAHLLMRMGEIDGAKALTDRLPIDRYTPRLYRVAGQVTLAAADINGLCPIAATGRLLSRDPLWPIAVGMCAAIAGDDITAAGVFDSLRAERGGVDPFDVRLGERVATLAGSAGRATNIDWNEAPAMTRFRYGVASGAGVAVPAEMLAALGPARFGWMVGNPGLAPEVRLAALRPAAVLGTMSAEGLVAAVAALTPGDAPDDTRAGRLRRAFAAASLADRRAALAEIWASESGDNYGARLESAPAAARLPLAGGGAIAADVIAALLAAGDTANARRWWPVAEAQGGDIGARAWALLAVGSGSVPVTAERFDDWRSADGGDARRAQLLMAALAGLGLADGAAWDGARRQYLSRGASNWTRAIDTAAAAGRVGDVALLAATGLQGGWREVPPLHLQHIVAALTRVGRGAEARLIAAEALTRG